MRPSDEVGVVILLSPPPSSLQQKHPPLGLPVSFPFLPVRGCFEQIWQARRAAVQALPLAGEDQRARLAAFPEHGVRRGHLQGSTGDEGGALVLSMHSLR